MGLGITSGEEFLMGISYGHMAGLLETICEDVLLEADINDTERAVVLKLNGYDVDGSFHLSAEECKTLFDLMTNETIDLRNKLHNVYEADYPWPTKELMNIGSNVYRDWDKWEGTISASMGKREIEDYNFYTSFREPSFCHAYWHAVDTFAEIVCFTHKPIVISFEEPARGLEDETVIQLILAFAKGAMNGKGVRFA